MISEKYSQLMMMIMMMIVIMMMPCQYAVSSMNLVMFNSVAVILLIADCDTRRL